MLGIFRALPGGGGRLAPIDKKQLGRELAIPAGAGADAQDGDLVAVEVAARRSGFGLPSARVKEKLGSLKTERAVSLIAIHAHAIPHVFPPAALAEAEAAKPARRAGREDWRELPLVTIDPADAKDHDDAVHAARDPDPNNPGGFVLSVAIADVAHYVRPGSALDREALERGNSVYFPDRVVPMLPERISNDLCSLRPERGSRRARGAHRHRRRRPQALAQLPSRADALGRQAQLPAGAGRDRRPARRHHRAAARLRARAALRRLSRAQTRPRRARAARSRPARAQDPADRPQHRRPRDHAGAARLRTG